jgi:quinol monooxygenase YgiN
MLSVSVTLRVRNGKEEAFVAAISRNQRGALRDEPGCHRFDVAHDTSDLEVFHIYEVYADEDAFAAHQASEHYTLWRDAAADLVVPDSRSVRLGHLLADDVTKESA